MTRRRRPSAAQLGEEVRQDLSRRLGREVSMEEAREHRWAWCRYLRAYVRAHDHEDGPRSIPARRPS